MDRLTSLNVFVRVVDCGGFSAAGRRLNMSATMVSNHVQSLESRLGVRLLNRTTRKVSLTDIGKVYYERCSQILGELEEADRFANALNSTPRGTLRLYTTAILVRFIAPVIAEFMTLYPEISIDHTVGEQGVDLIEDGFDLAIRNTPLPDSTLILRRLAGWRHVPCCAPSYLETHGSLQNIAELSRHNCLQYAFYPFGDEWRFLDSAGKPISIKISGRLITNNGEMLRLLALSGHGIFLAPSFFVAEDIAAGHLIRLLPDYQPVEFAMNAIYPNRNHLSAKVRSFLDLVAKRFAEHQKWLDPEIGAGDDV